MRQLALGIMLSLLCGSLIVTAQAIRPNLWAQTSPSTLDPAAWGGDHVGQPVPEFIESGECLFCHRMDVGERWGKDHHNLTIRDAGPNEPAIAALAGNASTKDFADQADLLLGSERETRFLRRSAAYGKLELLSVRAQQGRGKRFSLLETDRPHWDQQKFGESCAGCHATGVDSRERIFLAISLDCFACHGDAPLEHANDARLMPLAKKRQDPPRVVASICGQCHLRGGKARSTGLPYPNNFVAGDNLFRDFQFDFAAAAAQQLNPADRHVVDNIRAVVVEGREELTCLTCHDVHSGSTMRHRQLADTQYCGICHEPGKDKAVVRQYERHSDVCEY